MSTNLSTENNLRTHTLPNGFRIVTESMPGLESTTLGIWVNAGGRNESEDQNGIAHFLEHMAFKGTATRSALDIAEQIEDVGGYLNAYTSREMTAYYARVLAADVPLALDVISDILLNPTFAQDEIETGRGVILQEIGQALDTPDDVIFDWLQEQAYPDQPLGRTILGPAEKVSAFQKSDLEQFIGAHYGPGNMILAAAGAVDHDQLVKQAEALFGTHTARTAPAMSGGSYRGGEVLVEKDLEQAHFALAFEGPAYTDDGIWAAQLYSGVLGGGMSSRLFQELREKRGLCYTIYAQAGAFADSGMTTIYAGTSGDQVEELALVTIDEMKRASDSITQAELDRARAQMKAGMLMGLESPSNRAERLARMTSIWGRVPPVNEVVEKIDSVDLNALRAFGADMAVNARATLAQYGPVAGAADLAGLNARRMAG